MVHFHGGLRCSNTYKRCEQKTKNAAHPPNPFYVLCISIAVFAGRRLFLLQPEKKKTAVNGQRSRVERAKEGECEAKTEREKAGARQHSTLSEVTDQSTGCGRGVCSL
jgi:hypothetical protein